MSAPLAYPLAEAARVAGVSVDTLRAAIHATQPPFLRAKKIGGRVVDGEHIGGKYVVRAADLDAWLDSLPDA